MPWILKKIPVLKKRKKIYEKTPNQTKSNFLAVFVAERSVKSGLVDVSTAKLKESLSCSLLESVLGRITLCLPFAKHPLLAERQWPFLAPSPSYGFLLKVEGMIGSQGYFSPFHITASLVLGDKSGGVRKHHKPKRSNVVCSF